MNAREFSELYGRFVDVSPIARKRLDVAYAADSERQKLDVYYPDEGAGPFPVIVFFHGGGFVKGDKRRYQMKPALAGLDRGYAVVSVGYRLAPEHVWPAFVNDAAQAMAYVHRHAAELELDAGRVALWGESAGALMALQVGLLPADRVLPSGSGYGQEDLAARAVVDWYAPVDFAETDAYSAGLVLEGKKGVHEVAFGLSGQALLDAYAEADLLSHLRPGALPAVLVEHGLADELVPPSQSERLVRALEERGAAVESRFIAGGRHGVADYEDEENLGLVFNFLDRYMA